MSMQFPSQTFEDAVADMCHGTIEDDRMVELIELLKTNEDAQAAYLWHVEMHHGLRKNLSGELAAEKQSESTIQLQQENVYAVSEPMEKSGFRFSLMRSIAAAAAMIFLAALIHSIAIVNSNDLMPSRPIVVAKLVNEKDARWSERFEPVIGEELTQSQQLELFEGTAELEFTSGARLSLRAPVGLQLFSSLSAHLYQGQLQVSIEKPEAEGFCVGTSAGTYTDIGTKFKLSIDENGHDHLYVIEGAVEARKSGDDIKSTLVKAGESVFIRPDKQGFQVRLEAGRDTPAFQFPTIGPPSSLDRADHTYDKAQIYVWDGRLRNDTSPKNPSALRDGKGQPDSTSKVHSVFFNHDGELMMDLREPVTITTINTYSWYRDQDPAKNRERSWQQFELYGHPGGENDPVPDMGKSLQASGWMKIAAVESLDTFSENDHPAQLVSTITGLEGEIGTYRYLLWRTKGETYFAEFDVFAKPVVSLSKK